MKLTALLVILLAAASFSFGSYHATSYTEYREFPSPETFAEWGKQQPILMVPGQGFNNFTDKNDCDRQAEFLQRRALANGYLVSLCQVTRDGRVFDTYVAFTKNHPHVGIWTAIGKSYYYMDSLTHEVIKIKIMRD